MTQIRSWQWTKLPGLPTSSDQIVDKGLLALEQVHIQDLLPVITTKYKLILEEVNVGSLVPCIPQIVSPVKC